MTDRTGQHRSSQVNYVFQTETDIGAPVWWPRLKGTPMKSPTPKSGVYVEVIHFRITLAIKFGRVMIDDSEDPPVQ